jgi:hypothetical protein
MQISTRVKFCIYPSTGNSKKRISNDFSFDFEILFEFGKKNIEKT